jgi:hypothetical protein
MAVFLYSDKPPVERLASPLGMRNGIIEVIKGIIRFLVTAKYQDWQACESSTDALPDGPTRGRLELSGMMHVSSEMSRNT